jgi:hypothetical protein
MTNILPRPMATVGLLAGTTLVVALAGCVNEPSTERSVARGRPNLQVQAVVSYQDDYDYYPAYETYYSRNRREYVYRDGGRWVRSPQPRGVSVNVLLAAPSVRMDFRDSPEQHDARVVQRYPRTWNRPPEPVQVAIVTQDEYDYYPAYEVYYSRTRQEYVYRDGRNWVRSSQPRGISASVLLSAPSARMSFRDSPEHHHANVVRSYPKNWKGDDKRRDDKDERREDKRDDRDDKRRNDDRKN